MSSCCFPCHTTEEMEKTEQKTQYKPAQGRLKVLLKIFFYENWLTIKRIFWKNNAAQFWFIAMDNTTKLKGTNATLTSTYVLDKLSRIM